MVVAGVAADSTGVAVGSAVADISAAELRAEVERVLGLPEPIEAELADVPMELTDDLVEPTERGDPAAGHTVARPTARDTLALTVAGLRARQQVHVMVRLLMATQTQREPREITALLALTLIAGRPQEALRQQPTAETLRHQHPAPLAEWQPPIDQVLQ
jgi:hypothetical protein